MTEELKNEMKRIARAQSLSENIDTEVLRQIAFDEGADITDGATDDEK